MPVTSCYIYFYIFSTNVKLEQYFIFQSTYIFLASNESFYTVCIKKIQNNVIQIKTDSNIVNNVKGINSYQWHRTIYLTPL